MLYHLHLLPDLHAVIHRAVHYSGDSGKDWTVAEELGCRTGMSREQLVDAVEPCHHSRRWLNQVRVGVEGSRVPGSLPSRSEDPT